MHINTSYVMSIYHISMYQINISIYQYIIYQCITPAKSGLRFTRQHINTSYIMSIYQYINISYINTSYLRFTRQLCESSRHRVVTGASVRVGLA
eukprot:SAG31_NODE_2086_length_6484_cov_23.518716_7_plen_94_part_00